MKNTSNLSYLKKVRFEQQPYTSWKTPVGAPMPGYTLTADCEILISWSAVEAMAKRAVKSKSGRCISGPIVVKRVGKAARVEIPAKATA